MSEEPRSPYEREIQRKVELKLKAQRSPNQTLGFGLGMMGLVGWSVVAPTLLGTALGVWIDADHPGPHRWTLPLLVVGLFLGCLSAWHWIDKETKQMQDGKDA